MKQPRYQTRAKKAQAAQTAAYRQGQQGYHAGLFFNHCTYRGFSVRRGAWIEGWLDAFWQCNPDADPWEYYYG